MKTKHKARKRDLCQCQKPSKVIKGFDGTWLPGDYCRHCMKEIK